MSVPATSVKALAKIPFKNTHAESVPAFGVMQIDGSVIEDGVAFLSCSQTTTTLVTEFAINGPSRVYPGEKGVCHRQGDLSVAYDAADPEPGEVWGPRAGQWTLSRGYPAIVTVHAVRNEPNKILYGNVGRVASVMGKSATAMPALAGSEPGSQTVALHVWDGTEFIPAAPATTFIGRNASPTAIAAGTLTQFSNVNGVWLAIGPGGQSPIKLVKTTTSHASGASEAVDVWDGTPGSETESDPLETFEATNRTSVSIPSDKFCKATLINGYWYIEPWEC